ncbi:MAG: amino acid adenylation domain-containing protein [Pseudomonadota bacterium]
MATIHFQSSPHDKSPQEFIKNSWINHISGIELPCDLNISRGNDALESDHGDDIRSSTPLFPGIDAITLVSIWLFILSRYSRMDAVLSSYGHDSIPLAVRIDENLSWSSFQSHVSERIHISSGFTSCSSAELHEWSGISSGQDLFSNGIIFDWSKSPPKSTFIQELPILLVANFLEDSIELEIIQDGRYSKQALKRMLDHFRHVLVQVMQAPSLLLSETELTPPEERRLLLDGWNPPAPSSPTQASDMPTIQARFESHVSRDPGALALSFHNQTLSYGELDAQANRVARLLVSRGIRRGDRIGVCMHRGPDLIVALLGVLKAGAAYVPLDPAYPLERLEFIVSDADCPLVLSESVISLEFANANVPRLNIDGLGAFDDLDATSLDVQTRGDDLAYVIYTSGSTGQPKGVMVEHRQVCRLFDSTESWFGFSACDAWTFFHSFAFDFSVWEIWGALTYGGRLVIVPYSTSRSPEEFYSLIVRERVTVLNQTPSAFAQLMRVDEQAEPRVESLRLVIFGGEALNFPMLAPWFERHEAHAPRLVNMYGITETTVHVTYQPVLPDMLHGREVSVIGRPIPDLSVYILDPWGHPSPIGIPGELYVGGAGVARGYLNRPELNARHFLTNPFREGERLYRTGDLARFLPDGRIDYLGRIDHQVKIRGFRIELGEIESVLTQHSGIEEALVVAREEEDGKHLVAYLVTPDGKPLSIEALRAYLNEHLPAFMAPSAFVFIRAFPLTNNGKIDRKALPAPEYGRSALDTPYVAPRNATETRLTEIWQGILKVAPIGIEDNFFALGGDSIKAVRVAIRARQDGIQLPQHLVFEHPSIAAMAEAMAHLPEGSDATTVPLETADAAIALSDAEQEAMRKSGACSAHPLSFTQQGMLFHCMAEEDGAVYVEQFQCEFDRALDIDAFQHAWQSTVDRHPALHSHFLWEGLTRPIQCNRPTPLVWQLLDLSETDDADARFEALARSDANTAFDLHQAPLMRFGLVRLPHERTGFFWTWHHLLADGWSLAIVLREVFEDYRALVEGRVARHATRRPFADFIHWLERQDENQGEGYWRAQLADIDAPTPLGVDRRHAATGRSEREVRFGASRTQALEALARHHRVTPNTLLVAAWGLLLSRYSGQDKVVFGVTVAGRPVELAGSDEMIGMFINTLPLRLDIENDQSLGDWLQDIQQRQSLLRRHENASLSKIQRWSSTPGDQPLFESVLIFENYPLDEQGDAPLGSESGHYIVDHAISSAWGIRHARLKEETNFPLTLIAFPGQDLCFKTIYENARFDEDTIERLVGHLLHILDAMCESADTPVAELAWVTPHEQRLVTEGWNRNSHAYPTRCVHEMVSEQVGKTPDATALIHGDERISYRELDERANRLAHRLRTLGIGPECLVGVWLQRTPHLIISLLGILKAGGAYVPLDPEYPEDRIQFILEDADCQVLVTEQSLFDHIPASPAEALVVDRDAATWEGPASTAPDSGVTPENLAYVIYTSGSTGRPKGVAIEHRNTSAFIHWVKDTFGANEMAGVMASTSICFDLSVFEIFATLSVGGSVILAENALQLPELTARDEITLINTVPSAITELLRQNAIPTSAGVINLAGEPLRRKLVDQLYALPTVRKVYNLYGPSEDTTYSTWELVPSGTMEAVTIGRPIANTQAYILDDRLQPVPIGVTGELYLAGAGVSRGYLKRPELTEERYLRDPFSNDPAARMYRTGDLARYLPDGRIDFIGRRDHQVKLRGFRIELGEIQNVLEHHPSIAEALVMVREDTPGDQRLVAYLVPHADHAICTETLRKHVQDHLPNYMVPGFFIELDIFPLTPNGKIDRKALPIPRAALAPGDSYTPPQGELEEKLAALWSSVLGIPRVGRGDDFFALGGHSLLATQLMLRIHEQTGHKLRLSDLIKAPTIARQAELILLAQAASIDETLLTDILDELDGLSDEEIQALLTA